MRLAYQYRLYPTKSQIYKLSKSLELCRWVYNEVLATRRNAWRDRQQSTTLFDTIKMLPEWKRKKSELSSVYSSVFQDVCMRVDLAFKAFFRRVKAGENPGYPRFKGVGRYDSFTYNQTGFALHNHSVHLSKIGEVKIVLHRPIEGRAKTLTLRRDTIGRWYASFSCEVELKLLPCNDRAIGVDVGLESFATFSNGDKVPNPRFFIRDEKELTRVQRKFSASKKGTLERSKRRRVVAHIYRRIADRRKDFAHKISRRLANEYGIIAFEKLNSKNMLKNHHMAKSISDAAWNQFIQYTQYKAEWAGRRCVLVNPRGTSQRCSRCGTVVKKSLSIRIHDCGICGLRMDRDENAAINILGLGLQSLSLGPKSPP